MPSLRILSPDQLPHNRCCSDCDALYVKRTPLRKINASKATASIVALTFKASCKLFSKCLSTLRTHAGIAYKGNVFGPQEAQTTIATNFAGTRNVCERLERLIPDGGRIVNVCSLTGKLRILRSPQLRARFEGATSGEEIATLADEFVQGVASGRCCTLVPRLDTRGCVSQPSALILDISSTRIVSGQRVQVQILVTRGCLDFL